MKKLSQTTEYELQRRAQMHQSHCLMLICISEKCWRETIGNNKNATFKKRGLFILRRMRYLCIRSHVCVMRITARKNGWHFHGTEVFKATQRCSIIQCAPVEECNPNTSQLPFTIPFRVLLRYGLQLCPPCTVVIHRVFSKPLKVGRFCNNAKQQ